MQLRWSLIGALIFTVVVGCSSAEKKQSLQREASHLHWLLRLYTFARQKGKSPNSEQEFKQFIGSIDPAMADRTRAGANITSTDELFISERDGQPYTVFYGTRPKGVGNDVLAFEQKGVGGKRYVGYGLGFVEEVDEQRFSELVPEDKRMPK